MDLWLDVRYVVRRLVDARWFTLASVVALGLGIGANTTVFTFVNAVLLRGLPFESPDRIMAVWTVNERGQQSGGVSYLDYVDIRDQGRSFESMAAILGSSVNLADGAEAPERVQGGYVTGNFFRMLGEGPVLGRDFRDDDDLTGSEPVVILGHSVWQNRYASDPVILGRAVRVNRLVATVVGVMPPGMQFPQNTDIWIPRAKLPPESRHQPLQLLEEVLAGQG